MAQTTKTVDESVSVTDSPQKQAEAYGIAQGSNVLAALVVWNSVRSVSGQGSTVTAALTVLPVVKWWVA